MAADVTGERLRAEDPREIAGYRLLARIGEGGMGTVYLSRTRGGQPVALKVIRRDFGGDPGFRARFEQEVQAARRVQGYHVVPVVDHDTTGERPWLASVFVPGLPLHEALAAHGPLPLPAVLQLVGATARALTAIHSAGIVHRDLKPSNILLKTPWGKSAGTTPEQCLEGARDDVLPAQIEAEDLRTTIPVGTVLCTETDEGNLAMLKVTDITTGAGDLPDYATKLTLFKQR